MASPVEEFGPYLVYEQIGLGGMASVHRAETRGVAGFRKAVALKRMLPSVANNPDLVKSFIREARLASHMRHANVAQTYDLGKVGDIYFIAMELVPGRNLREILRQCVRASGPMPMPLVLNVLNQVCDALDYAHNLSDDGGQPLGIIHRDVSPANVIVSETGVAKLIDFGVAKGSVAGMQTLSGMVKGKLGYMAPENLDGKKLDARADLFALGVIAHELIANRPLFHGKDDMDTLMNMKSAPIALPSQFRRDLPTELDSIVMTALERDPDRRWQRASALRNALTSETKRLGMVTLNSHLVTWIEWAFAQHADGDGDATTREPADEPSISISGGTEVIAAAPLAPTRAASESVTRVLPDARSRGPSAPPPLANPQGRTVLGVGPSAELRISPPRAARPTMPDAPDGRVFGVGIIVLVVAAATAAVVYFALPYFT